MSSPVFFEGLYHLVSQYSRLLRWVLGENSLLSFILLNDIRNDKKFKEYDIEYTGNDMRNDYFVNNGSILDVIFKYEFDKKKVNVIGPQKIEDVEMLKDLRILKEESNEIEGTFLFDFVYETKCKCAFRATKSPGGKWIVQELRIPKKGSDKLEDGLLVYSRDREKAQ